MKHTIFLEIAPVAKGRPRFSGKHAFTPKKTRDFEANVVRLLKAQFRFQPLKGPITLTAIFHFPRPKRPKDKHWHIVRPDLDNLVKSLDAANGILWEDDCQIVELYAVKKYVLENTSPKIVLTFSELDGSLRSGSV